MGDKAGAGAAAEGSSIFESLFGGFSNGLSIFTNNPFRRKQEVTAAKAYCDSKNLENGSEERVEVGNKGKETAMGISADETPTGSETDPKNQRKQKNSNDGSVIPEEALIGVVDRSRLKKLKRDEDGSSEKKKRRKRADAEDGNQEINGGSVLNAAGEKRKRKQETSASSVGGELLKVDEEETENVGDKKSKKTKKLTKREGEEDGDEQIESVKRQSERQRKKRANELSAEGQESASLSESKTAKMGKEIGNTKEEDVTTGKESSSLEVGEKRKKKMKLVNELSVSSDVTEAPKKSKDEKGSESKRRSKRKAEDEIERSYEKKLRGSTDVKEDGGDMDAESNLKGKRKVVDEEDDEFLGGKVKKRKLTKQQKIDNKAKLKRTIFVGNVPVDVKAKELIREFSQYGVVDSARLRSVPIVDVKMPRRAAVITGKVNENRTSLNGYVVFKEEASAKAALAHNMKEFRGKHLRVDLAPSGSSGVEYDRKRSIFVGNLPFDAEDEDLITLFQGTTPELELEAVRVVRDPQTSAGKGFAFVCFKTKAGAEAALDKKEFIMFKNRHLRLERFGYKPPSCGTPTTKLKSTQPKSQPGAERRISERRAPAPYEGERAGKRKGMMMSLRSSTPIKIGRRAGLPKRPAVAAKKARALQKKAGGNAAGTKVSSGKRKREEKGKRKDSAGKASRK